MITGDFMSKLFYTISEKSHILFVVLKAKYSGT